MAGSGFLRSTYTKWPLKTTAHMGDSLTLSYGHGLAPHEQYPTKLQNLLNTYSQCNVKARNFGIGGTTTSHMLGRQSVIFQYVTPDLKPETPDLLVIEGGVNDPVGSANAVGSITSTGTTATVTISGSQGTLGYYPGMTVTVSGATPSGYNGTVTVVDVPSATTFTYAVASGLTSPATGSPIVTLPAAQTQANIQRMVLHAQNRCAGFAGVPSMLPAGLDAGTLYLVANDTSSTGGLDPTDVPGTPAPYDRVPGTHSGPQVWQSINGAAGEAGWCRVAQDPTRGVQRIVVMTTRFLNYTPNGDTPSAQNTFDAPTRQAQIAAASAAGVNLFDLWAYQAALITSGVEIQNSASWHSQPTDQHPNTHGTTCWAQGLYHYIQSQQGWIEALT